MDVTCPHCKGKHFKIETKRYEFSKCCKNSKVNLPAKKEYPTALKALLFDANHTEINTINLHRRKTKAINYRQLNNSVAFRCFTANIQKFDAGGPDIFKIAGQPYHNIYALHPDPEDVAKYN